MGTLLGSLTARDLEDLEALDLELSDLEDPGLEAGFEALPGLGAGYLSEYEDEVAWEVDPELGAMLRGWGRAIRPHRSVAPRWPGRRKGGGE